MGKTLRGSTYLLIAKFWFESTKICRPTVAYKFIFRPYSSSSYLDMSIRESVPGPMRAIHTVGQTVARHLVVSVIPPLSRHFCHCCFPPKVHLQPFVNIVTARTPGPGLTATGDFVKPRELRNVVSVVIRRC